MFVYVWGSVCVCVPMVVFALVCVYYFLFVNVCVFCMCVSLNVLYVCIYGCL